MRWLDQDPTTKQGWILDPLTFNATSVIKYCRNKGVRRAETCVAGEGMVGKHQYLFSNRHHRTMWNFFRNCLVCGAGKWDALQLAKENTSWRDAEPRHNLHLQIMQISKCTASAPWLINEVQSCPEEGDHADHVSLVGRRGLRSRKADDSFNMQCSQSKEQNRDRRFAEVEAKTSERNGVSNPPVSWRGKSQLFHRPHQMRFFFFFFFCTDCIFI